MSMHIAAKPGEIAADILLPGDPVRAQYIAETYLENARRFNDIRLQYGFTGTYHGRPVSVMSTGMGVPSIMIYATELIREYGCRNLIRFGTSGGVKESLQIGDVVLSSAVSTTSGINDYDLPGHFAPAADFTLLHKAYHAAEALGIPVSVGNTLTNDYLYVDDKPAYSRRWERYGILVSEQEAAGLYTVAAKEHAAALAITTVVVNLYHPEQTASDAVKERGLDPMIRIALDTLTK
jgi:purine-nucleoside phosphorylase